ncbi:uncharacterized protein LAESUDRAFT_762151 [Laetiporus sulphureus 93-53]|uniref:Uncharacterized protein n=1 Tax=Laetiporus sulphureus 93-53 TaxID=1314785 RepID=A0A165CP45_9APHY|nr:uncharacterized protein LAESUDRAFT_762151 [Laetiporus sulphureus 93-53]KZT03161.1 hypothetical protein LAESUDRAFT_762151 [Laetiporus sulphureus 93-53]
MLLALVFLHYFSQHSVAAPIADIRSVEDLSPSCDKLNDCRTLLSIVSSCIATIIACVWTAVHPDIPPYREDPWWQKFRRIGFTISAIIAPEIYIYIATFQYMDARKIARMHVFKEHGWTTTHGFFVLMGGFVLCNPAERSTKQLEAKDIIILIDENIIEFPYISEEEIQDKSKANWLSKTAAVVQTFWFALQVLARFIERLPITELEIFTAGFTIMAIAMYALWLKKPFCVDVPIVLHEHPNAITVAANVTLGSIADVADVPNAQGTVESEAGCPTNASEVELGLLHSHSHSIDVQSHDESHVGPRISIHCHSIPSEERTFLQNLLHPLKLVWDAGYELMPEFIDDLYPIAIEGIRDGSNVFYRGLLYAVWAVTSIILVPTALIFAQPFHAQWWHRYRASDADHVSPFVAITADVACMLVVPTIFGLIHCTAWFSDFPTVEEQYLWRILSLVITCIPAFEASVAGILAIPNLSLPEIVAAALVGPSVIFGVIALIPYVFSRLILLVIAFTTLRALPPDAYKAISWVELIPHF